MHGRHAIADPEVPHLIADFEYMSRGLIADDVRTRGRRHRQPTERIAPLDRDRFDADEHFERAADRVRHVLVAEYARRTILAIHGGFHAYVPFRRTYDAAVGSVKAAADASAPRTAPRELGTRLRERLDLGARESSRRRDFHRGFLAGRELA